MRRQRRDEHTFTRVSNSSSDLSSSPPPMAFKITAPFSFPLFPPNLSPPAPSRSPTELRFSRWNNTNAEPFLRRERAQKEIEDDLRRHRRFDSANRLAADDPTSQPSSIVDFRSHGTPSSPSSPSIPGKASKYSKPPQYPNPRSNSHPAFRRAHRLPRVPPDFIKEDNGIVVGEKGISYKVKDAPFEFQYSYTETPKVRPLALREAPFLPFGPDTMPRPWTGRAPLPASKKKLPEFDSFKLPPAGKKGVKPVQAPGPYLGNSGPRYAAATREEILGEPLTEAEVQELVKGNLRTRRQLNMGRDGLTHNMLDNIHAHWKRRRVCKIKCKGVCTVDMDNVHQQLEEKTGGKIFYCKGGVIYLFRGRNYNYRTRPRYPLMLWKPVTPVYPRLVQHVPEGLTLEEATEMRKRGRKLSPICKLGKNGVYSNLVKNVREAFEACELVRINCKDMNKSDCRKIGAKLKDLVPCVLISFEFEHILIWRGKDWKSSLEPQEDNHDGAIELIANDHMITSSSMVTGSLLRAQESLELHDGKSHNGEFISEIQTKSVTLAADLGSEGAADLPNLELVDHSLMVPSTDPTLMSKSAAYTCTAVQQDPLISVGISSEESSSPVASCKSNSLNGSLSSEENKHELSDPSSSLSSMMDSIRTSEKLEIVPADNMRCDKSRKECLDRLRLLLRQAVECGSAVILDDESLDANIVFERSVTLAKTAPPGPVFQHRIRKPPRQKIDEEKSENHEEHYVEVEAITIADTTVNEKNSRSRKRREFGEAIQHVVPHGSLKVDELAKLLA